MDRLQFFASVLGSMASAIGSIAWPIAAVVIVLMLKKQIGDILPALSRVTFPGGSAEFDRKLIKVEAEAEAESASPAGRSIEANMLESAEANNITGNVILQVPQVSAEASGTTGKVGTTKVSSDFEGVYPVSDSKALKTNPAGVVMESWRVLELTLRSIIAVHWPNSALGKRVGLHSILKLLDAGDFLKGHESKMLNDMLELRNLAAHTENAVTEESAARFEELARHVTYDLSARSAELSTRK